MRVRCPQCETGFTVDAVDPSAPVGCPSCACVLGRIGDAATEVVEPIPIEAVATLGESESPAWCVAFAPAGGLLASGAIDGSVKLWSAVEAQERARLPGHAKVVTALAFSGDGHWLASASMDGVLKLWDCWDHVERPELSGYVDGALAFAADHGTLATGAPPRHVRMWDVVRGRDRALLDVEHADAKAVAFAPDGGTLAVGHLRESGVTVQLWSWADRKRIAAWSEPPFVSGVAFSPDGSTLAAASLTGQVRLWDVASGTERGVLFPVGRGPYFEAPAVLAISFSPDGRWLGAALHAGEGPNLQVFETATGRLRAAVPAHADRVQGIAFGPEGGLLATASRDRTVKLWRVGER